MPVLPLPEGGLKAITKFRHQRREARRQQQHYVDNHSSSGTDFEFEPFGEAVAQHNSPSNGVEITSEKLFDKEMDEEMPSTSEHPDSCMPAISDTAESKSTNLATLPSFEVLARGEGFLAISTTIEGNEYSGMLFKTQSPSTSSNLPALFSPNARQKFIDLCQQDKVDVVADQWVSMLTTRQLLPSRQRRTCSASWAKRQGRMVCYSCLCVVPQENSMPFACKCRERQRQRASRLKCGYLPPKNRLVVVGKANRTPKTNGQQNATCVSKKKSSIHAPPTSNVGKVADKPNFSPLQNVMQEEKGSDSGQTEISPPSNQEEKSDQSTPKELTPLSIVIMRESNTKDGILQVEPSNGLEKVSHRSLTADQITKTDDTGPLSSKSTESTKNRRAEGVKRKKSSNSLMPMKKRRPSSLSNPTWSQAEKTGEHECFPPCLLIPSNKEGRIGGIPKSEHKKKTGGEEKMKKIVQTALSKSFPPMLRLDKSDEDVLSNIGSTPQYVIRNNSPLQMTILKVQSPNKLGNQLAAAMDTPSTSRFCLSPSSTLSALDNEHQGNRKAGSADGSGAASDLNGIFTSPFFSAKSQKAINLERRISLLKQSRSSSVNYNDMPPENISAKTNDHTDSQPITPKNNQIKTVKEKEEVVAKDEEPTNSKDEAIQDHGIRVGDVVWARAKQSAYWPGEVAEVGLETVKVAWCGETTYNEVDVAMVEPFTMETLANRFSPSHKDSGSKKKLCLAIAEAIEMIRPPKIELNLRLNTAIANLLSTKFQWNLDGVTVYRGQKRVLLGNNKSITKRSSSPENQQVKAEEMTPNS